MRPIADTTLTIGVPVRRILRVLARQPKVAEPDTGFLRTMAYYNGRERGFCIEAWPLVGAHTCVVVASERRSDRVIVWVWQRSWSSDPPTQPGDNAEERLFGPDATEEVANEVGGIVRNALASVGD